MDKQLKTYTPKERNMYLIGLVGQNIIYNIIGAALAYYLQFTILIPAIAVSVIMSVARVWDAFNDPMMGTIVDKTRTKIGKCRPYLIAVPMPILIITVLCFANFGFFDPAMGMFEGKNALIVIWAAFTYIMWGMTYTVGDIPLWGVTALMTESAKDREKLLALARIVAGLGGGVAMLTVQPVSLALGNFFYQNFDSVTTAPEGERLGFIAAALIYGIIGSGLFQLTGIFVRERIPASKETYTLKKNFSLMWTNKPFRQILLSGVLGSPKMLLALAALPLVSYYYATKDPLKSILYVALLGGGLFIGQFVAMGFAPKLTDRFEKKDLYNYANLLGAIPYALMFVVYLIAPKELTQPIYIFICFLLFTFGGATMGLTTVLQSFMIADAVDYEDYHNNIRPDGVFFSGQTFIAKLTTGIATIISGLAYHFAGFSDKAVEELNAFIEQGGIPRLEDKYSRYMFVLFFLVSIPPAIGSILSVIPTWKYALPDKEHKRMLEVLNERRRAAEGKNEDE
ncbi:MAG TPA: MFS transporter [Clostridiales bacterium]|nr:MFS transporter [Clostridiales bacterium]